ncbi:DUF4340 domain-containing protein [Lamprobacter modestohalophilus]|uniref:DUF4340 domain-containing protein n=1 Tax=Lamprobacter modestohalophilus TaxID=1064514 RepID=UPI002ADEEA41|nr:DUF4340 domain-containing protein [Lamprobacter modestohalophilus]MEA1049212.1 DUF4340 domain-containing protein [Lamprobacter modestohalophilus]
MSDRPNGLAQRFRNPLSRLEPSWRRALQTPAVSALIALLVAQLVAALVLAGNAMQTSSTADAPLLNLVSDQVKRIEIDSADEQVVLARATEGWVLPALADFPADADKVDRLLSTLTALQRPLPVGASAETQRRLKVADDNAERRITLYGNTGNTGDIGDIGDTGDVGELTQLLTGDSPGFRRLYARLADEETVYDLPLANVLIASDSGDWLRRDQLHLDAGAIERVHSDDWSLSRIDGSWRLTAALADQTAGTPTSAPAPEQERMEVDHREREGTGLEGSEREGAGRENTGREGAGREDETLEGAGPEPTGLDQAEPNPTKMGRSDLDSSQVEALLSRIANLSYQDVRMPATAAALTSEPLLRLDIGLDNGSRRSRTVFADGNGSYRLQTGTDPWLYELSEYDLDGLLGLDPKQLLARQADEPSQATATPELTPSAEPPASDELASGDEQAPSAELNPVDSAGEISSHPGNGSAATVGIDPADGAGPADGTNPADEIDPNAGADPTDDRQTDELGGAAISESSAPSADMDRGTESATEPTTAVGDSSAAEAEPDFRPQQRPVPARSAPPQWPYQRYAPPSGQTWPPQGSPPQATPGWR